LTEEEYRKHVDNYVHGVTTELLRVTEFTIEGFLPKVFLPFYTPPGTLPRKVQIDRLVYRGIF
jgi:hypothetical protein